MRVKQTSAPETLEQLIAQARAWDIAAGPSHAAFGVLVERFQDSAYRYAVAVLGDPHLAWDAAQEAFLTAYCSLNQLRTPEAFPGWLHRIVQTHCRRLRREQQQRRLTSLDAADRLALGSALTDTRLDKQVDPALVAEGRERRAALASAVRTLPAGQQVVTLLFYVGGYPQPQIAERLNLPLTTVKKRLQAARQRLQAQMVVLMDNEVSQQRTHRRPGRSFAQRVMAMVQLLTAFADDGGALLELLVVDGLDVNTPDGDRRTLLSWAAQRGQVDTINWLLHQGASLNAPDRAGLTPLAWAERTHQDEAAWLLRQSGGRE